MECENKAKGYNDREIELACENNMLKIRLNLAYAKIKELQGKEPPIKEYVEYIEKDKLRQWLKEQKRLSKNFMLFMIDEMKPDIYPVKQWYKYPEIKPIYDGDYLCYHKGYCNVYEYFKEQWFSESGEVIKQIDKDELYWQELPKLPETIKG